MECRMMEFEYVDDPSAPYGFLAKPKYLKTKKVEAKMHLDTEYVRISIDTLERHMQFLFDKDRNHISWEERAKEVALIPVEIRKYPDGYRVERRREIMLGKDEHKDGREHIIDRVYLNDEFLGNKNEIEILPMEMIYKEFRERVEGREKFDLKRKENKKDYLDPSTPKEKRIEILYSEVSYYVAMYAYHPMVRDHDKLVNLPNYDEYLKLYFSEVENKEENYIDYLKAYNEALRENILDDDDYGEDFIRQKCKEAKLLHLFNRYYKKN